LGRFFGHFGVVSGGFRPTKGAPAFLNVAEAVAAEDRAAAPRLAGSTRRAIQTPVLSVITRSVEQAMQDY